MRRFIKYHGALLRNEILQVGPAAFLGGGEEAFKAKPSGRTAGDAQSGDHSAGTGNGAYRHTGLGALLYKLLAGVRDGRTTGIGYQCAGFSGQDPV